MTAYVRTERDGTIGILWIDRPDKRNALTPEMLDDLSGGLTALDGARAVVVAGVGDMFCSGFDLSLCVASPDGAVMRRLLTGLSAFIGALRRFPAPVVVAARGAALAGGCAILGGGDVVVTDPGARLGYPVVRIGVSPGVSAPFLTRMVGFGAARARLLDPGVIAGSRAVEIGLAHECVVAGEVLARSMSIARALATKPARALAVTKAWCHEVGSTDDDDAASRALAVSLSLAGGPEERAMLAAAMSGAAGRGGRG